MKHRNRREESDRYTFLETGGQPRARVSLYFSLGSAVVFAASMIIALATGGSAPLAAGALSLAGALCAVYAFWLGIRSLSRRDASNKSGAAAAIVSGLMMIVWLTVYLNGIQVGR